MHGLHALVVDDEQPVLDELVFLLGRDERIASVRAARSGTEALRVLEAGDVDLVALALGAVVLTSTTAINTMLDAIIRWIGPLRRVGVRPDRVALTFALAMRAIPGTIEIAQETRDAARARGLGKHPRAFLSPFVIRVVARAYETGDALAARGIGDD